MELAGPQTGTMFGRTAELTEDPPVLADRQDRAPSVFFLSARSLVDAEPFFRGYRTLCLRDLGSISQYRLARKRDVRWTSPLLRHRPLLTGRR